MALEQDQGISDVVTQEPSRLRRSGWHGSVRSNVRRRMEGRCKHMTPEERERFRQGIRARWGFGPSTGESKGL